MILQVSLQFTFCHKSFAHESAHNYKKRLVYVYYLEIITNVAPCFHFLTPTKKILLNVPKFLRNPWTKYVLVHYYIVFSPYI